MSALPGPAWAHGGEGAGPEAGWMAWNWDPLLLGCLALGSWLYGRGLLALWERGGDGRGISRARAAAYGTGLVALFVALVSPVDAISAELSSMHMVQHMVLMMVAAPLLVLGAPGFVLLWALPPQARRALIPWIRKVEAWNSPWYLLWQPLVLWTLFAVALWIWHVPPLYQAALRIRWVHDFQHLAFLGTSFLFWRVLFDPLCRLRLSRGLGVLYLFTTSLHAGALGVFLALSPRVWYVDYEATAPFWRLTALEDQQLAGYLMWMPGCVVYAAAAAVLFSAWLREPAR